MADLIDRQALREAMYHEAFETDSDEQRWDSGCWIRYKMFERILDSLPSAQPERKTGRWIHDGYDFPHGNDWAHCSVCGKRVINVPADLTRYCPYCGTDMKGGNDETD